VLSIIFVVDGRVTPIEVGGQSDAMVDRLSTCYLHVRTESEKNKKKFFDAKKAGGGKNQSVVKDRDKKGRPPKKGGYQRSQFSNAAVGNNGIVMVAGVPHLNCKKCGGLQPDHGSSTHDPWAAAVAAGAPYVLPPSHPLAIAALAKSTVDTATGATAGTAATASVGADAAGGSPGISRSAFERNLRELERTSTDPNSAATCTLLRNLLLKG